MSVCIDAYLRCVKRNDVMNDAMTPASPALRLIEFWQLPQTIPSRLADRAKLCLLDALGCGLFGAGQPWGEIMSSEIFYQ